MRETFDAYVLMTVSADGRILRVGVYSSEFVTCVFREYTVRLLGARSHVSYERARELAVRMYHDQMAQLAQRFPIRDAELDHQPSTASTEGT